MLEIRDISFAYEKGKPMLKKVSMAFQRGEITGILGANGSGKSTLMKVIMRLLLPQQGEIFYENRAVGKKKKSLLTYRQAVNLVFQNPEQQLFFSLVRDDVAMALENLGFSDEEIARRVQGALGRMGILELADAPIQYLSYGQKKRVAIADVLALQPHYLLLDEPTAGLDPSGREKMLQTMKELASQGVGIILSSHDMDLMYEACDYAYLLREGELISEGTQDVFFQQEELLRTAGLESPWIVQMHQMIGTPLVSSRSDFIQFLQRRM